jgi:flagellar biosynthetic protein FlhB
MAGGAEEKTEKPTEKRIRDARRKGQVAKSYDLTSALMLISAAVVFTVAGGWAGGRLASNMRENIIRAAGFKGTLDSQAALAAIFSSVYELASVLAPLLVGLVMIAAIVSYLQVGPIFAFEPVKPTMNKLNPFEGFKQKFLKARPYLELCKTIVKIIVVAVVTCLALWDNRADIIELTRRPVYQAAGLAVLLVLGILARVAIVFLIIAVGDFFLQRFLHRRELRMTKHEVKEEYKETEGNPLHKIARRQVHREILMYNLMMAVKKADVVVANPTHYAIALQYDRSSMNAPVVVAKGVEFMAAHIRQIAEADDVPIVEDIPLAHALYEVEVETEIPEQLYTAVAVVLRWVYQLAEDRQEVASCQT